MRNTRIATVLSCATLFLGCTAAPGVGAQVLARPDRFGDVMELLLPVAAAALTLERDDAEGLKELALSGALSLGTTEALKSAVSSPRPDGGKGGFPSAHASGQWAAPMYGLATLVGYSRVKTGHHSSKDVVGGALIGIGSALASPTIAGP